VQKQAISRAINLESGVRTELLLLQESCFSFCRPLYTWRDKELPNKIFGGMTGPYLEAKENNVSAKKTRSARQCVCVKALRVLLVKGGHAYWQKLELINNYFGHLKRYCIIHGKRVAAQRRTGLRKRNPGSGELITRSIIQATSSL
jgi:hypothetical protein